MIEGITKAPCGRVVLNGESLSQDERKLNYYKVDKSSILTMRIGKKYSKETKYEIQITY
jgi:hypothetical protein